MVRKKQTLPRGKRYEFVSRRQPWSGPTASSRSQNPIRSHRACRSPFRGFSPVRPVRRARERTAKNSMLLGSISVAAGTPIRLMRAFIAPRACLSNKANRPAGLSTKASRSRSSNVRFTQPCAVIARKDNLLRPAANRYQSPMDAVLSGVTPSRKPSQKGPDAERTQLCCVCKSRQTCVAVNPWQELHEDDCGAHSLRRIPSRRSASCLRILQQRRRRISRVASVH